MANTALVGAFATVLVAAGISAPAEETTQPAQETASPVAAFSVFSSGQANAGTQVTVETVTVVQATAPADADTQVATAAEPQPAAYEPFFDVTLGYEVSGPAYEGDPTVFEYVPAQTVELAYPEPQMTMVQDSIDRDDDQRTYTVAPSTTGNYRFWFSEMMADFRVDVEILDHLGQRVHKVYGVGNGEGVTEELQAGEVYTLVITSSNKVTGCFELNIGSQRATLALYTVDEKTEEILPVDVAYDEIGFKDQLNRYVFTAAEDGEYRFQFAEMMSGFKVDLRVFDHLNQRVALEYGIGTGEGCTVTLKAGETYVVEVSQSAGFGTYQMHVGYARPALELDDFDQANQATAGYVIYDQVSYRDEVVSYALEFPQSGTCILTLSDMMSDQRVDVFVYDHLMQKVVYEYSMRSGDNLKFDFQAGEEYIIQVRYSNGVCAYTLSVDW